MQGHMSYNTDALIENPLYFILLFKLLIMTFFWFYYCIF